MFRKSHPLVKIANSVVVDLPCPVNIHSFWNFGSLLGLTLVIQLLSGILLATRFSASPLLSFDSVVSIIQDRNYGWLLRLIHSTGASFFFLFMFLHVGRGLYFGSYSVKPEVWNTGVLIVFLLIGTAFLGYVLPWGQISYWAATVITNLLSAIPYFGPSLVEWVWGGFAVGSATLIRFFALHYLLPFIITAMVIIHLFYLHQTGRSNPLGVSSNSYKVAFHSFFSFKDIVGFVLFFLVFIYVALVWGYALIDRENFIPANPLVTPIHIQPEWYFLFAYAILRSIPNKLGGVVGLVAAVAVLFLLPLVSLNQRGGQVYSPFARAVFWVFIFDFFLLTWLGSCPAEDPYIVLSLICTVVYFGSFLLAFRVLPKVSTLFKYGCVRSIRFARWVKSPYGTDGIVPWLYNNVSSWYFISCLFD